MLKINFVSTQNTYEACVIVSSLMFLLNEQLQRCIVEFMRLNDEALNCISLKKPKEMITCYDKMKDIVEHLEPMADYLTKYSSNFELISELFKHKTKKPSKELFESYKILFKTNSSSH